MRALLLGIAGATTLALSCTPRSPFMCFGSDACGTEGICEPTGFCSFPDPNCDSGQRYGDHAPEQLASECVPVSDGSGDSSADASASTGPPPTTATAADDSSSVGGEVTLALTSGADSSSTDAGASTGSETGESLDPDLVAWYRFESDPVAGVLDDTANALHGECPANQCPTLIDGPVGTAIELDGVDDFVRVPHDPLLDTTEAWTIALWMRIDALDEESSRSVIAKPYGPSYHNSYQIFLRTEIDMPSPVLLRYVVAHDDPGVTVTVMPPPLGTWAHVAGTWDGATARLYVDGDEVGTTPAPESAFDARDLLIGADQSGDLPPSIFFPGAIDEVRIYARALDVTEIAAIAAAP